MARPVAVGDIVHFVSVGTVDGAIPGGVHFPAIVITGGTGGVVDLTVFFSIGWFYKRMVSYAPAQPNTLGTWHWPEQNPAGGPP